MKATEMFQCIQRVAASWRSRDQITNSCWLIGQTLVSYTLMHVFFFGIPRFEIATEQGKLEIGYTLSNLGVTIIAAFIIGQELLKRRKKTRPGLY
jgi:hypothetical protein